MNTVNMKINIADLYNFISQENITHFLTRILSKTIDFNGVIHAYMCGISTIVYLCFHVLIKVGLFYTVLVSIETIDFIWVILKH